ncbi:SPARC-related modular calcium-binding protein 1-like isoform X3 [Petromyzon marinus]|uniref:SPARC-related modular calcium-binding protein 1-like isoform X3 n=1 Tax=Petromyzon marinus TaxID=7757 RepID=UPI003F6F4C89
MVKWASLAVLQYAMLCALLPQCPAQKAGLRFLIGDGEREAECRLECTAQALARRALCGSDGRTYDSRCDFQRAKCREGTLEVAHRGRCKVSRCQVERTHNQQQARKPQEGVFVPECNEDGTYAQVQCHSFTGYCWCVTPDGRPVGGSSVKNKLPKCTGPSGEKPPRSDRNPSRKVSFQFFLFLNADDGSKPTPTQEPHFGDDDDIINAPTLWSKQLSSARDGRSNGSSSRHPDKSRSCEEERQSVLEEDRQHPREGAFVPECAGGGGLYQPVQCYQTTGYCWCVLVDTGRPIPGSSTSRYQTPKCEPNARSRGAVQEDPYDKRDLAGCPGGKKAQFITSLLDALITDMVKAVKTAESSPGMKMEEPDPSQTLEERAVRWFFTQLDRSGRGVVGRKEMRPLRRFLKRRPKPQRCGRKFMEYCDLNGNKALSLPELKGCLGVGREQKGAGGNQAQRKSRPSGVRQNQRRRD